MSLKIVHYPHPALRHKSRPLTSIDEKVRTQARQMLDLMYEAKGLGLASNQVALTYRMVVINPKPDDPDRKLELVLINPVLVEHKGTMEGEEGCLSFPDLFTKVRRFKQVKVQAYRLDGELVELTPNDDLSSRLLQHEIDHLDGILFIDKMGPIAKLASRSSLKEFERLYRKAQEKGEIPPDKEIERKLAAGEAVLA